MGTPGVPWVKSKAEILEHLKKHHGRVTHTAKSLGVHYETLKKKIDADPELTQQLSDIRNASDELFVDHAENCVLAAMQRQDDMNNALKASFFVLNSKGRNRNWTNTHESAGAIYLVKQDPKQCSKSGVSEELPTPSVPDPSMGST